VQTFKVGYIYLLKNLVNGKAYVGQTTKRPETRWDAHLREVKRSADYPLYRAIKKYGFRNFSAEVLHTCTLPLLDFAEQHFIRVHNAFRAMGGYNLTTGGQRTHKTLARSARKKISDKKKAEYADPEARAKHSKVCKVAHNTPEAKANHARATIAATADPAVHARRCAASRKRFAENPVSEETRRKQSIVQRKRAAARTPEEKANFSRLCTKRNLERYQDLEARKRTGAASAAAWASPETRAKASESLKRRWADPAYRARLMYAAKHHPPITPETLAKRSASQLARYKRAPMTDATRAKISRTRLERYGKDASRSTEQNG